MSAREDYIQFCSGLEKHILKTFPRFFEKTRAEEQVIISKPLETIRKGSFVENEIGTEIRLYYPKISSERQALKYAILSWWLPEWTRFELQEALREKAIKNHWLTVESYVYSKDICLYILFSEADLSHGDLFGNILQPGIVQVLESPEGKIRRRKPDFCYISKVQRRKPKRIVRRRGYNDHGSLRPSHERRVGPNELSGTEQYELELQRTNEKFSSHLRVLQFISEFQKL